MRHYILSLLFILFPVAIAQAQLLPAAGAKARYAMTIELPKAYVSGVCLLHNDGDSNIKGSIVNEFGVSFIDFSYSIERGKVRLHNVAGPLNKWYIRIGLRRDLRGLLLAMRQQRNTFTAGKRTYTVTPMPNNEYDEEKQ